MESPSDPRPLVFEVWSSPALGVGVDGVGAGGFVGPIVSPVAVNRWNHNALMSSA